LTVVAFFVAEMGDKTQIATVGLAAAEPHLVAVILGTTSGMLIANLPLIVLGQRFADRIPFRATRIAAALLMATTGVMTLLRVEAPLSAVAASIKSRGAELAAPFRAW
jgi:putative Ca2+/H+ antiporter (TMEM165/GDT1 family)